MLSADCCFSQLLGGLDERLSLSLCEANARELAFAHIGHQCRSKAADTSPPGMPNTGINHASRTMAQQIVGQSLRLAVAGGIQAGAEPRLVADIVEVCAEIGEIIAIGASLGMCPPWEFLQFFAKVECHFVLLR